MSEARADARHTDPDTSKDRTPSQPKFHRQRQQIMLFAWQQWDDHTSPVIDDELARECSEQRNVIAKVRQSLVDDGYLAGHGKRKNPKNQSVLAFRPTKKYEA